MNNIIKKVLLSSDLEEKKNNEEFKKQKEVPQIVYLLEREPQYYS